MIMGLGKVRPI